MADGEQPTSSEPPHAPRSHPSTTVLVLRNISKSFATAGGPRSVLSEVDLEVPGSSYISIRGRSGSGKSSLLAIAGLLDKPTSGSVQLCGTNVDEFGDSTRSRMRAERIGFVFQSFFLREQRTALDNVELGGQYLPDLVDGTRRREAALDALDEVGLSHRAHDRAANLSGGERQRVAIARAIIGNPALILADEPTGSLDDESAKSVVAALEQRIERGQSVIVVTHDLPLADRASRSYDLRLGALVEL